MGSAERKMIGRSRAIAERVLQKQLGEMALNEHGIMDDQKITLRAFAKEYLASKAQVLRPKSFARVQGIMKGHLLREFGHLYLYDITPERVYAFQSKRLGNGITHAGFNRELSCLKNLLSVAVEWKKLKANPIAGVKQLKEAPGRLRFLELAQINTLLDCCAPHLAEHCFNGGAYRYEARRDFKFARLAISRAGQPNYRAALDQE